MHVDGLCLLPVSLQEVIEVLTEVWEQEDFYS